MFKSRWKSLMTNISGQAFGATISAQHLLRSMLQSRAKILQHFAQAPTVVNSGVDVPQFQALGIVQPYTYVTGKKKVEGMEPLETCKAPSAKAEVQLQKRMLPLLSDEAALLFLSYRHPCMLHRTFVWRVSLNNSICGYSSSLSFHTYMKRKEYMEIENRCLRHLHLLNSVSSLHRATLSSSTHSHATPTRSQVHTCTETVSRNNIPILPSTYTTPIPTAKQNEHNCAP